MSFPKLPDFPSACGLTTLVLDEKSFEARDADFADEAVRLCRWPRMPPLAALADLLDFCDTAEGLRL
jgi:hypothetical protein